MVINTIRTIDAHCTLCNQTDFSIAFQDEKNKYLMCEHCGLVFLDNRPDLDELDHFYKRDYQLNRHGIDSYEAAVQRLEKKDSYERKKQAALELKKYIAPGSNVLEIGVGYGTFLKVLKDIFDCEVEGIEPAAIGAKVAQDYYGLKVIHAALDSALQKFDDSYTRRFDVVIMLHVLEHLKDPISSLKNIRKLLKEEGLLYLAVPNVAQPEEALDSFFHIEHLWYFSPKTLCDSLTQAGYKILKYEIRPKELIMVAALNSSNGEEINTDSFNKKFTPNYIQRKLSSVTLKYKILRSIKKFLTTLLPVSVIRKITVPLVKILRNLGIITV